VAQGERSLYSEKGENYEPLPVELPAGMAVQAIHHLMKKGKCGVLWRFDHSETDITLMLRLPKGALSYDPRYKPLVQHELEETELS
jgi:hypothetical protein